MPVATKITGRQVVEVAVTAHVLSTRSRMHYAYVFALCEDQSHNNNMGIG